MKALELFLDYVKMLFHIDIIYFYRMLSSLKKNTETFEELFARTGSFLREVIDPLMEAGKNVLIVGHGAMNLSIISQIRKLPIQDFWTPGIVNCKMIRLI